MYCRTSSTCSCVALLTFRSRPIYQSTPFVHYTRICLITHSVCTGVRLCEVGAGEQPTILRLTTSCRLHFLNLLTHAGLHPRDCSARVVDGFRSLFPVGHVVSVCRAGTHPVGQDVLWRVEMSKPIRHAEDSEATLLTLECTYESPFH
jgi:hypothetical protein